MFQGKKVALVATGGGARGIAHAGVIKACNNLGIEFDLMVGASAGALATVLYSQYKDTDYMLDYFRTADENKYGLRRFGWGNMISTKKLFSREIKNGIFDLGEAEKFFRETLPTNDFKELYIPTYVAATNLDTREGVLFGPGSNDSTPISKALVASCCIPLLFRPVEIDGSYYIDGEIRRSEEAIEALIYLGAQIIIVSNIYGSHAAGVSKSGMYNITSEIINMVLEDKSIRGVKSHKQKYPDKEIILIEPDVSRKSIFNTAQYKELYNEGYKAAKNTLEKYNA